MTLTNANPGGIAQLQPWRVATPTTPSAVLNSYFNNIVKQYPDASVCDSPQSLEVGGRQGQLIVVCFTCTPPSGRAVVAADIIWAATSADGATVYDCASVTALTKFNDFVAAALYQLMATVQWRV